MTSRRKTPYAAAEAVRYWRERLEESATYENAVGLQQAERNLRDWRKANIKEVRDADDTGDVRS